jgi:TolB-like protein
METAPKVMRFGPFEVNLLTGELRKRGIRIALQEQPRRILSALLEAAGEIVTREDLCRRLWPTGTFVDFEHSLNAAVRRLRVTLGDDADIPRFIETIPRRGYRFLPLHVSASRMSATSRGRYRLAVIPFSLLASESDLADAAARMFVAGLVDEAVTQLARACSDNIAVIARTSVLRLGREQSAADVGRALGASYLLQGSVRRDAARVRITAQLIESQEETHIWAATYDRMLTNALTVQTEVAEAIAEAVVRALGQDKAEYKLVVNSR